MTEFKCVICGKELKHPISVEFVCKDKKCRKALSDFRKLKKEEKLSKF